MYHAPSLPDTLELYVSQPNIVSTTQAREIEDLKEDKMNHFSATDDVDIETVKDRSIEKEIEGFDSLRKGMTFESEHNLKFAVKSYSMQRHRHFDVIESKGNVWAAKCKKYGNGCMWRLRASFLKDCRFKITQYNGPHTCDSARLSQDHGPFDTNHIASIVHNIVMSEPSVAVCTLQSIILKRYRLIVGHSQVLNGKRKAIMNIFGDWEESYDMLPKWTHVLEITNPGSKVSWRLREVEGTNKDVIFHSVFWAFGPVIEGFKHCIPLLQIDCTNLYGKYKEKLLIATSIDANGLIYPVAFAIVPDESVDTWGWFLRTLWLEVVQKRKGMCLISGTHECIVSALRDQNNGWEDVHHRFCLRHVASSFNQKYNDNFLKTLVHRAGSKFQARKYELCMLELEAANKECMGFFNSLDPIQWTQSHDGGHRYGWLTTNLGETVNSVMKRSKRLPIAALVRSTFYWTVSYFAKRRFQTEIALDKGKHFTRYAIEKLVPWESRANKHKAKIHNHELGKCEVTTGVDPKTLKGGTTHEVMLNERTCTCNKWQSYGIPCSHAIAACKKLDVDYKNLLDDYYKLTNYLKCYSPEFEFIPDERDWPSSSFPTVHPDESRM